MKVHKFAAFALLALLAAPAVAMAQSNAPLTDEELRRAFENAYENFGATVKGSAPVAATPTTQPENGDTLNIISDRAAQVQSTREYAHYLPLENLRVNVNFENAALQDIMRYVTAQASDKVGPWEVEWRLKEENRRLLNERVNLTAEANFNDFMGYLVDRVNNMTGIQLFVRVFKVSRVIVISDTF